MKKLLVLPIAILALTGCKKEYDTPPLEDIPVGNILTIDSIRNWQIDDALNDDGKISIQSDLSVYAVVTMDETDGNIYKNIYMQDATGAVNVRLLSGGGVYQGDSIRLYLKGCVISEYNGVLQIDSVDVDNNIIKQATNIDFPPAVTTIDQITPAIESELVQLNNVQFILPEISGTYADAAGQNSVNLTLEDAMGNTVIVRTSGYASFANEQVAQGSGSLVAIVGEYNGELQLYIRSFNEINMTGARFPGLILVKDFDDFSVTSGGWTVQQIIGSDTWETSSQGSPDGTDYGTISNYTGTNNDCESWLISPSFDLTGASTPWISFNNAYNYTGDPLQLLVSTDYTGTGDPNLATWATLSPTWSTGGWAWVNSGNVDLSGYISNNVHIAFKYTGNTSSGSTWEIDDIIIHA